MPLSRNAGFLSSVVTGGGRIASFVQRAAVAALEVEQRREGLTWCRVSKQGQYGDVRTVNEGRSGAQ